MLFRSQDGASKEVTTQQRRHRRVKRPGFSPGAYTREVGWNHSVAPKGEAAPTGVADTGVKRQLELSLGSAPTYTTSGITDSTHASNRASRSESGRGTVPHRTSLGAPYANVPVALATKER